AAINAPMTHVEADAPDLARRRCRDRCTSIVLELDDHAMRLPACERIPADGDARLRLALERLGVDHASPKTDPEGRRREQRRAEPRHHRSKCFVVHHAAGQSNSWANAMCASLLDAVVRVRRPADVVTALRTRGIYAPSSCWLIRAQAPR